MPITVRIGDWDKRISVGYKKAPYSTLGLTEEYPRKENLAEDQSSLEKVWFK